MKKSFGEQIAILKDFYEAELTIRQICEKYHISGNKITEILNSPEFKKISFKYLASPVLGYKNKTYYSEEQYANRFKNYTWEDLSENEKQFYNDNKEKYSRNDCSLE